MKLVTNLAPEYHHELLIALNMPCVRCDDSDNGHRILVRGDDDHLLTFCGNCAARDLDADWLLPDRFAATLCSDEAAELVLFQLDLYTAHAQGRVPLPRRDLRRPSRWMHA